MKRGSKKERVMKFEIESEAGCFMGMYEADGHAEALDKIAQQAGYVDHADMAELTGPFKGTVSYIPLVECHNCGTLLDMDRVAEACNYDAGRSTERLALYCSCYNALTGLCSHLKSDDRPGGALYWEFSD